MPSLVTDHERPAKNFPVTHLPRVQRLRRELGRRRALLQRHFRYLGLDEEEEEAITNLNGKCCSGRRFCVRRRRRSFGVPLRLIAFSNYCIQTLILTLVVLAFLVVILEASCCCNYGISGNSSSDSHTSEGPFFTYTYTTNWIADPAHILEAVFRVLAGISAAIVSYFALRAYHKREALLADDWFYEKVLTRYGGCFTSSKSRFSKSKAEDRRYGRGGDRVLFTADNEFSSDESEASDRYPSEISGESDGGEIYGGKSVRVRFLDNSTHASLLEEFKPEDEFPDTQVGQYRILAQEARGKVARFKQLMQYRLEEVEDEERAKLRPLTNFKGSEGVSTVTTSNKLKVSNSISTTTNLNTSNPEMVTNLSAAANVGVTVPALPTVPQIPPLYNTCFNCSSLWASIKNHASLILSILQIVLLVMFFFVGIGFNNGTSTSSGASGSTPQAGGPRLFLPPISVVTNSHSDTPLSGQESFKLFFLFYFRNPLPHLTVLLSLASFLLLLLWNLLLRKKTAKLNRLISRYLDAQIEALEADIQTQAAWRAVEETRKSVADAFNNTIDSVANFQSGLQSAVTDYTNGTDYTLDLPTIAGGFNLNLGNVSESLYAVLEEAVRGIQRELGEAEEVTVGKFTEEVTNTVQVSDNSDLKGVQVSESEDTSTKFPDGPIEEGTATDSTKTVTNLNSDSNETHLKAKDESTVPEECHPAQKNEVDLIQNLKADSKEDTIGKDSEQASEQVAIEAASSQHQPEAYVDLLWRFFNADPEAACRHWAKTEERLTEARLRELDVNLKGSKPVVHPSRVKNLKSKTPGPKPESTPSITSSKRSRAPFSALFSPSTTISKLVEGWIQDLEGEDSNSNSKAKKIQKKRARLLIEHKRVQERERRKSEVTKRSKEGRVINITDISESDVEGE